MGDLIDRQMAIETVGTIPEFATLPNGDKLIRKNETEYALSYMPSAQPERKKGRWIFATEFPGGVGCYICTACNAKLDSRYVNFCPNCGADMRGDKDD